MGTLGDNTIIVVLGPTSSGKSSLAVKLAKRFDGEVVSADSRQVYKGMDIGSGKITEEEMEGIPHHLLNVASPKRRFDLSRYQKLAEKEIDRIIKRSKLPIVCGGTAFYTKALTEGMILSDIKPDWKLREKLEKKSKEELFNILSSLDPKRAEKIEKDNPRRLIRAIEIVTKSNQPVPKIKKNPKYRVIKIGIKKETEELNRLIKKRLIERLNQGMIEETMRLRDEGLSWKRIDSFGLEYRWTARYLQGKIDYQEMFDSLLREIIRFSKKQMTWYNRDQEIVWVKNYSQAVSVIKRKRG